MTKTADAALTWADRLLAEIGPVWHRLTCPLHACVRVAALTSTGIWPRTTGDRVDGS